MGGNSSTRRVTVVNDNQNGVIRISESVVKKLKNEQKESPSEERTQSIPSSQQTQPSNQQIFDSNSNQIVFGTDSLSIRQEHEREIKRLENSWRKQSNELERQNRELWKSANDKLSANLNEVEKKYVKTKCEPICRENEKKVIECYQKNKTQPLKCSKEVKGFINCVHEVRKDVLNRKG